MNLLHDRVITSIKLCQPADREDLLFKRGHRGSTHILLTAGSLFTRLSLSILMIYQRYDDRVNRCKSVVADHHVSTSYPSTYIALLACLEWAAIEEWTINRSRRRRICANQRRRGAMGKHFTCCERECWFYAKSIIIPHLSAFMLYWYHHHGPRCWANISSCLSGYVCLSARRRRSKRIDGRQKSNLETNVTAN